MFALICRTYTLHVLQCAYCTLRCQCYNDMLCSPNFSTYAILSSLISPFSFLCKSSNNTEMLQKQQLWQRLWSLLVPDKPSSVHHPRSIQCAVTAEDRWCKCVLQDRRIYVPANESMHLHINSIIYLWLSRHLSLCYWVCPACVSDHTSLILSAQSVLCVCCDSHHELSASQIFVWIPTGQTPPELFKQVNSSFLIPPFPDLLLQSNTSFHSLQI